MEQEMKKTYKKPNLKFVSMRNEETVANTCWGGHGNSMTWYYDTKGDGYVSFQIGGGKCTLDLSNITYYNGKGEVITNDGSRDAELEAALKKSGGESGNPFKGEGVDFLPNNPDPSWS